MIDGVGVTTGVGVINGVGVITGVAVTAGVGVITGVGVTVDVEHSTLFQNHDVAFGVSQLPALFLAW